MQEEGEEEGNEGSTSSGAHSRLLAQARSALLLPARAPPPAAATGTGTPFKNHSFKSTLQRAKAMDSTVQQRVDLHQIRLEELQVRASAATAAACSWCQPRIQPLHCLLSMIYLFAFFYLFILY